MDWRTIVLRWQCSPKRSTDSGQSLSKFQWCVLHKRKRQFSNSYGIARDCKLSKQHWKRKTKWEYSHCDFKTCFKVRAIKTMQRALDITKQRPRVSSLSLLLWGFPHHLWWPLDGDSLVPGKLFGAHSLMLSNCFPKTHPWATTTSGMRFRLGEGHLFSLWGNVLQKLNRCPSPPISESRGGCLLPPSPQGLCLCADWSIISLQTGGSKRIPKVSFIPLRPTVLRYKTGMLLWRREKQASIDKNKRANQTPCLCVSAHLYTQKNTKTPRTKWNDGQFFFFVFSCIL